MTYALIVALGAVVLFHLYFRDQTEKHEEFNRRENDALLARIKDVEIENRALIFALGRKPSASALPNEADADDATPANERSPQRRLRPGKFVGFSQEKKKLER